MNAITFGYDMKTNDDKNERRTENEIMREGLNKITTGNDIKSEDDILVETISLFFATKTLSSTDEMMKSFN